MRVDPNRYRQTLLSSITDDGLEELTLRLARPDYPEAHRAGPGKDGGIDVLSDFALPPQRAWQCKNRKADFWDDCRDSLGTAMADEQPPGHYTFVFPQPLTGPQREFWRKTFLPEQRRLYPDLETLDLWDDLAERLEAHPELVEQLSEGAFSSAYRRVAEAASQTSVNPLASIIDLVGDAPELARRAVESGRTDPRYQYENRQREARPDDRAIPEGRMRFGFAAPTNRPREFTVTVRAGDAVEEKAAAPRPDAVLKPIAVWVSDTPEGTARRDHLRGELSAGRPVDLECNSDVGIDARPLPDRFVPLADPDGILRSGSVEIGLSEPLELSIAFDLDGGTTPEATLALYRIPSDPGYSVSYGGTFRGALLFLDIDPDAARPDGRPGKWADTSIAVGLDAGGVAATELVTGLGLALAFGRATKVHLECAGVLPTDGMTLDIAESDLDPATTRILEHAIIVSTTLAALTEFDGRERRLSVTGTEQDVVLAELVDALLRDGEVRSPLVGEFRYSVPNEAPEDPLEAMRGVRRELGRLSGEPTVIAEMRIEGAVDGRYVERSGVRVLEVQPLGPADVVLALVGPVDHAPI